MKRKGQARMTETISVLFIFFILLLFGIVFYYQYQKIAIKEQQEEQLASRAMEVTLTALFLPELQCSRGEAEPEDNCFDLLKMEHAGMIFQDPQKLNKYYFDIFSYATIIVNQTYPEREDWVLYDKPKIRINEAGEKVPDYTKKEPTYFVVALRNDFQGANPVYSYGYVKVEVYS